MGERAAADGTAAVSVIGVGIGFGGAGNTCLTEMRNYGSPV